MLKLFALPAAILVAGLFYGAMVLASDLAKVPARTDAAAIVWTQETGAYLGTTSVRCPLLPSRECHAVLSAAPAATSAPLSARAPSAQART